ncbi:hypothetical protein [Fervidobacterium thailandense]|uniref:hypothetical protein n=1 Tax=Fervidobacterium thailandense TaxID=1008305 RepID=UPI0013010294|nr:hypothetical protein [Fervidobacterium thailandense]
MERGGQEVYRGTQNSFVDNVKADGSMYMYRVYAISGTFQSRPVEVTVTAHSPLVAPKVNVSRTPETIIITVVRPDVRDYRESYIEVDGNVYKTEVLSLKNEPDKVYKVKAYWSNTSGQKSEAAELVLETSPKPPIVEYRVDGANVILKITDPSTVIKAEKFVVIYGSRTMEVLKGEATIQIDTSKSVHEFKVYSVYKDLQSSQTSVMVILKN